jgi:hypothetical protein
MCILPGYTSINNIYVMKGRIRSGSHMQYSAKPGNGGGFHVATSPESARDNFLGRTLSSLCLVSALIARPHSTHHIMSDKPIPPPAEGAASATVENVAAKAAAAPKALPEQNAAFRMMGRCIAKRESQAAKMRYGSIHTDNCIA